MTNVHGSKRNHRQERGLALFEILIVVAILAMISTGVAVAAIKYWEDAKKKDALTNARAIRAAIKTFWIDHDSNECPSVDRLIAEQVLDDGSPRNDPWGNPWKIECEDGKIAVTSHGRDKKANTDDDLRAPAAVAANPSP